MSHTADGRIWNSNTPHQRVTKKHINKLKEWNAFFCQGQTEIVFFFLLWLLSIVTRNCGNPWMDIWENFLNLCVLGSPPPLFLLYILSHACTIQLEEEEEEKDKFDLNISVTNPEKVGKSIPYNSSRLTSKEVSSARTYCSGKWNISNVMTVILFDVCDM